MTGTVGPLPSMVLTYFSHTHPRGIKRHTLYTLWYREKNRKEKVENFAATIPRRLLGSDGKILGLDPYFNYSILTAALPSATHPLLVDSDNIHEWYVSEG